MKTTLLTLALVTTALALAGCDAVTGVSPDAAMSEYASAQSVAATPSRSVAPRASCPCFSRESLAESGATFSTRASGVVEPALFFDVFDYYGLDPRRTEVRSTVRTGEGVFEEVAAVYLTPDNEGLHLICMQQEVVRHPASGQLEYEYRTLGPTVEEAEACRQELEAFVADRQPCQGAACGIPYTDGLLAPDFPPYHDEALRTPDVVLDEMLQAVKAKVRLLGVPA